MLEFLYVLRTTFNLSKVVNVILIDETAGSGLESWEALVGHYGSPSDGPFPGSKVRYRRWVDEPVGEPASRPTWCTEATTKLRSQEAPPQPRGDQGMDYWTDDAFLLRPRMPSLDVEYGPAFE